MQSIGRRLMGISFFGQCRGDRTYVWEREVRRGWLRGADALCHDLIGSVPWCHHRRWMYERFVDERLFTPIGS